MDRFYPPTHFNSTLNASVLHELTSSLATKHILEPSLQYFYVVVLAIESFFGTLGNMLVIATICAVPALRTTSNAFIINLSVSDLFVTVISQPFSILGALLGEKWFQERPRLCLFTGSLCAMGCIASTWTICMITVNRYVLICRYSVYSKIYSKRNSALICLAVWISIFLVTLPNHVGWGEIHFSEVMFMCTFAHHIQSYAFFYICVGILIPVSVSCAAYVAIFRRVRSSNLVRTRIFSRSTSSAASSNKPSNERTRTDTRKMKLVEFRRTIRMVRVLFRVFIVLIVMAVPLAILLLIGKGTQIDYTWYILAALLAHGNSSVNCLVYASSLEHFQESCARLLRVPCRNHRSSSGKLSTIEKHKKVTSSVSPAKEKTGIDM